MNRIKCTHVQLELSPGVHKKTMWSLFKLFSFYYFPRHFLLVDAFLSFIQNAKALVTSLCHVLPQLGQHPSQSFERTEVGSTLPFITLVPSNEGHSSTPSEFWILQAPLATGCGWMTACYWVRGRRMEKWRENGIFLYSLCPFRVLFPYLWGRPWGLLLEFSPSASQCLLPVC